MIESYGVQRIIYADDTQIYAVMSETDHAAMITNLERCLCAIREWSLQNDLKLNSEKTGAVHVKSSRRGASPCLSLVLLILSFNQYLGLEILESS